MGVKQLNYDEHKCFNEIVDELHDQVSIFDETFDPSKILFELAPEAYRLYLAEHDTGNDEPEKAPKVATAAEQAP